MLLVKCTEMLKWLPSQSGLLIQKLSKTNIISVCPITTKQGKTALNVLLDKRTSIQGAVLCAHCKAVDLSKRGYKVVERVSDDKLIEILDTVISMVMSSE